MKKSFIPIPNSNSDFVNVVEGDSIFIMEYRDVPPGPTEKKGLSLNYTRTYNESLEQAPRKKLHQEKNIDERMTKMMNTCSHIYRIKRDFRDGRWVTLSGCRFFRILYFI